MPSKSVSDLEIQCGFGVCLKYANNWMQMNRIFPENIGSALVLPGSAKNEKDEIQLPLNDIPMGMGGNIYISEMEGVLGNTMPVS